MKVAIIGTGYVGLPTGVGLAELGHEVVCIDREISKIAKLQAGEVTLYEDGLEDLLKKNFTQGNIKFTTSMQEGINGASLVIIAVGTPPHPVTHEADLHYLYAAASELAHCLNSYTVVATKSTVPVGTGDSIEAIIKKTCPNLEFDVISLPEFLREGYAVHDFFNPDRIVVGANSQRAQDVIAKLYAPLLERSPKTKMLYVSRRSSETIKYAANSFLATKIHFINEMADFCEKAGANIYEVASGMGLDRRIGSAFLNPGPGFGGSCFPKDTLALDFMARQNDLNLSLVHATIEGNNKRIESMAERILAPVKSLDRELVVGILGLAFKEGTDDCRVSPAMHIVETLLKSNKKLTLQVFDPQAMGNAQLLLEQYEDRIQYCTSTLEVAKNADVLAILTEWPEFRQIEGEELTQIMRNKAIVDCRNMLLSQREHLQALGFYYRGIGI